MNISFHGAARIVTGSKHIAQLDNSKKLLLDCGMFPGHPQEADRMNRDWGFEPSEIDYMVLSHAHVDHEYIYRLSCQAAQQIKELHLVHDEYKKTEAEEQTLLDSCFSFRLAYKILA